MLHSDIQLRLAVPTDPCASDHRRQRVIFDRNLNSNTVLGLDLATPVTNVDGRGRPNHITSVTLDVNASSGTYDEGFAQGVIDIHYYPSAKKPAACSSKAPLWSRSTARSTRAGSPSSCEIRTSIRDARVPSRFDTPCRRGMEGVSLRSGVQSRCPSRIPVSGRSTPRSRMQQGIQVMKPLHLLVLTVLGLAGPALHPAWADEPPEPQDLPFTTAAFQPLPLGSVKPSGWLREQLELQASGLSGHLDEFWPDIKNSAWNGGKAEGWERVPYWLDGMVPLAYLLDDPVLKTKVTTFVDYIVEHQYPDGWLGPIGDTAGHKAYDPWPLFPLFKALTQYQEATGDPRIIPALLKCARKIDQVINQNAAL